MVNILPSFGPNYAILMVGTFSFMMAEPTILIGMVSNTIRMRQVDRSTLEISTEMIPPLFHPGHHHHPSSSHKYRVQRHFLGQYFHNLKVKSCLKREEF